MVTWLQIVEVGLKYSKTLISIAVFVISLTGYGVYNYVESTEPEVVKPVEKIVETIVIEQDCNKCKSAWRQDIEKVKEELEEKYHR